MRMHHYLHSTPGRLRIRIPIIKASRNLCSDIQNLIINLGGVNHVCTNQITGSVTVRYDVEKLYAGTILELLIVSGFLEDSNTPMNTVRLKKSSFKAGHAVIRMLFGWVVGKALKPTGLSFLAAII